MVNPNTAENPTGHTTPNAKSAVEVRADDLPVHCPTAGSSLWNSHPQVYIPVEETGKAKCPYCGCEYHLVD